MPDHQEFARGECHLRLFLARAGIADDDGLAVQHPPMTVDARGEDVRALAPVIEAALLPDHQIGVLAVVRNGRMQLRPRVARQGHDRDRFAGDDPRRSEGGAGQHGKKARQQPSAHGRFTGSPRCRRNARVPSSPSPSTNWVIPDQLLSEP